MASIRADISTKTRVYVQTRYGEPAVAELKQLGAHWDPEQKCWWVGSAKRKAVEDLLIATDQSQDRDKDEGRPEKPPAQIDPHKVKIYAKVEYQSCTYFLAATSRDDKKVKLVAMPDDKGKYIEFWADKDQVKTLKEYKARERWDGRRYSGKTVLVQMTLGELKDFITQQKNPDTRRGQCTECGAWGPSGQACSECCEGHHYGQ